MEAHASPYPSPRLKDNIIVAVSEQVCRLALLVVASLGRAAGCLQGLFPGLELGVFGSRVALLLASDLLESVKLFSVELVQLRVDVYKVSTPYNCFDCG